MYFSFLVRGNREVCIGLGLRRLFRGGVIVVGFLGRGVVEFFVGLANF